MSSPWRPDRWRGYRWVVGRPGPVRYWRCPDCGLDVADSTGQPGPILCPDCHIEAEQITATGFAA